MTKPKQCEQVIKQITEAFVDTPRPKNDNFGYDWYDSADDNMATKFSKYKHWSEIPFELLYRYRDDLIFLTREGFRYILPAVMSFVLIKGHETDMLIENIIHRLQPPELENPELYNVKYQLDFAKNQYTVAEKSAVYAYLKWHKDMFYNDYGSIGRQQDNIDTALIYWYLLSENALPKPDDLNS